MRHPRHSLTGISLFLLMGLIGCAKEGPVCYPVRGQVSLNGKPLAEALVVLHSLDGRVEGGQQPIATTDDQGRFSMSTFATGDGAPRGHYALTVELRAPRAVGEEVIRSGPNLLPPRYGSAKSSRFRYEIVDGENDLPPIRLSAS